MTYVLGVKSNGVGAIIADTMVTFNRGDHNFGALKSGLLFPGCTYGASGDAAGIRHFVTWGKQILDEVEDTLEGFWNRFQELLRVYDFNKYGTFELLLLSRHTGAPHFYILDSRTAQTSNAGDFVSLGSGKPLLDEHMLKFFHEELRTRVDKLGKDGWPVVYWPFYFCQELIAFAQGDTYEALQKIGVGGVFHYLCQTSDAEHVQEAALYVVMSIFPKQRQISHTVYRVLYGEMALVVENGALNDMSISLDTAVFPELEYYDESQLSELKGRILADVSQQPYYRFAGFVFADPKYQAITFDWIRGDDAEMAITPEGNIHPGVIKVIDHAMAMVDNAE